MLSGDNIDRFFWKKSISTTCYLVNRSPSLAFVTKNPYEVCIDRKHYISHLRVFGCEAFIHVPKEKHFKLDAKAQKCIFVGYSDNKRL